MTRTRWTGLAGLLFGLVFFGINIFGPSTPDQNGHDAVNKYAAYWSNHDHQIKARVAMLLASYACILLLAFAAGLRDRLRAVDAGPLPSYCLAAGTAAAALLGSGAGISFAVGLAGADTSSFKADGALGVLVDEAGYGMLAIGLMAAGSMAVAVGIVTLRTRVLPAWTAWLGFLLGLSVVGSLFSAWTAFIGLPLWSVVVGITMLVRTDAVEPVAAA